MTSKLETEAMSRMEKLDLRHTQERNELIEQIKQEALDSCSEAVKSVRGDAAEAIEKTLEALTDQIYADSRSERLKVKLVASMPQLLAKVEGRDPRNPDRVPVKIYLTVPVGAEEPRAVALVDVTEEVFTYNRRNISREAWL